MHGEVFVNYRTEDSGGYALLLHRELSRYFGAELVFLDSVNIPPGADYVSELVGRVRRARVMLALIGRRWLSASDEHGRRLIDNPEDWVRRELVEALTTGVTVIPVLIDGVEPPSEEALPTDLAGLARCQYRRLRTRDAAADLVSIRDALIAADPGLAAAAERGSRSAQNTDAHPSQWVARPAELPPDTADFTGRTGELGRLVAFGLAATGSAAPGIVQVCAVDGMAGVGKTALAIHAGHQLAPHFPDGCLFVDLHGHTQQVSPLAPTQALGQLLRGLGVRGEQLPEQLEDRVARYRYLLAGKRMLVVLDNARTAEQVRPLLPGSPGSLVIVTSRHRLIALDEARPLNVDVLPVADAVDLFTKVAGADRTAGDPEVLTQIVELCGHLPLAIRLAAAKLRARPTWTVRHLALRLTSQHEMLSEFDDGERSVAAAFYLSYRDLTSEQRRLFRRLSLHPGSDIDSYAAAALAGVPPDLAGLLLDQLVDAHLLTDAAAGRYRFHDLVRVYAGHLADSDDTDEERGAAATRLFDLYLATAAAAMDTLYPADARYRPRIPAPRTPVSPVPGPAAALAWLDTERANLVATCQHTATHGWPTHTTRLAATLSRNLEIGGHYADAMTVHTHARAAARELNDRAAEAHALASIGAIHRGQGRHLEAAEYVTQALNLYRQAGDIVGQAHALSHFGAVYRRTGQYTFAATYLERAIDFYRQAGDTVGEARALNHLGGIHRRQGRYDAAADHYVRALALSRSTGDRCGQAHALHNIGVVHARQGDHQQAADHLEQALSLNRETGHRAGEARALTELGAVHARQGHYRQAAEHHQQALTLVRAAGDCGGESQTLNGLGEMLHAIGAHTRSYAEHTLALVLSMRTGDNFEQARAHAGIALAHYTTGQHEQAGRHWRKALALYTTLGAPEMGAIRARLTAVGQGDRPAPGGHDARAPTLVGPEPAR